MAMLEKCAEKWEGWAGLRGVGLSLAEQARIDLEVFRQLLHILLS
jgi:hypothetical protein